MKRLLSVGLVFSLAFLLNMLGCGGGGGGGTVPSLTPTPTPVTQSSSISGYVYLPKQPLSGSIRALQEGDQDSGAIIVEDPSEAPEGYEPGEGVYVGIEGGEGEETDENGYFEIPAPPSDSDEDQINIIIDPSNRYPAFMPVIMPILIPQPTLLPVDEVARLVIIPRKALIPVGRSLQFWAFGVDSNGVPFRVPQNQIVWSMNGDIGNITSHGLFTADKSGIGQIVATLKETSLIGYGTIKVFNPDDIASLYGKITDAEGNPVEGAHVFVSGVEFGAVTGPFGNYLFPRVPPNEELEVSVIFNGRLVAYIDGEYDEEGNWQPLEVAPGERKKLDIQLGEVSKTPTPLPSEVTLKGYILAPEELLSASQAQDPETGIMFIPKDIYDNLEEPPAGYVPLVGVKVWVGEDEENFTLTDGEGYFTLQVTPSEDKEETAILYIDPTEKYPELGVIALEIIIPYPHENAPATFSKLIVIPERIVVRKGKYLLYNAYGIDGFGRPFWVPPQSITWALNGAVGTITSYGLFHATAAGQGTVVATVQGGKPLIGYGNVKVIEPQAATSIFGRVTDTDGNPIPRAILFITGVPYGVVSGPQGGYLFPLVPSERELEITVMLNGHIVAYIDSMEDENGNLIPIVLEPGERKQINIKLNIQEGFWGY